MGGMLTDCLRPWSQGLQHPGEGEREGSHPGDGEREGSDPGDAERERERDQTMEMEREREGEERDRRGYGSVW